MSDESELKQLRADLEVIERYEGRMYALAAAKAEIGNKIDKLEAAADPWWEAKQFASAYRDPKGSSHLQKLIAHYDHLSAEVARLTERVAELEDVKPIADMQPPFEGPIVGIEPVLDPARVLATAAEAIDVVGYMLGKNTRHNVKVVMRNASMYEKPYRLKGGDGGN